MLYGHAARAKGNMKRNIVILIFNLLFVFFTVSCDRGYYYSRKAQIIQIDKDNVINTIVNNIPTIEIIDSKQIESSMNILESNPQEYSISILWKHRELNRIRGQLRISKVKKGEIIYTNSIGGLGNPPDDFISTVTKAKLLMEQIEYELINNNVVIMSTVQEAKMGY